MTQQSLAEAIQVSTSYIHQLETGKTSVPNYQRCRQLAWALKADFHQLWLRAVAERIERTQEKDKRREPQKRLEYLTRSEKALIKLVRAMDDEYSRKFRVFLWDMLGAHHDESLRLLLDEYMRACIEDPS